MAAGAVHDTSTAPFRAATVGAEGADGTSETRKVIVEVATVPESFVADTTTEKLPAAVGVPESTPVEEFNVSPVGRVPVVTEYETR